MRKRLYCLTLATILTVLTACGSGSSDSPTTPEPTKAAEVTKAPEPTEAPEMPTEEAATPTPVPEEKSDLIIDGYNITEFNKKDKDVAGFVNSLSYDEPRLVVAIDNTDLYSQDIIAIISYEDHFVAPKDQNVIVYVYDTHEIGKITGDHVEGFAMTVDGSKKVSGFRLKDIGEEETQVDINVKYKDDQYNEDIMKGTPYTFYVKKGDTAN